MPTNAKSLVFGPYQVLERIGQGAYSRVFKARHHHTGAVVALKVGWKRGLREGLIRQFQTEFELSSQYRHPNLVAMIDQGKDGSYPYLVTEFVEGPSLEQYLANKGRLLEKEAVRIAVQVADALHFLHKKGAVHREVSPAKILLNFDGRVKLINLGRDQLDVEADMSRPGGFLKSLFTAPELIEEPAIVDPRTDVYSLAMCIYQAVTGELPWDKPESMWSGQRLILPSERNRDLGFRIDFALRQGLQRIPELRVGNCADFIKMLTTRNDFLAPEEAAALPAGKTSRGGPQKEGAWPYPDRRITVRHQVESETRCQPFHEKANGNWKGFLQDVSLSGVSLRLFRRFEIGTLLRLETNDGTQYLVRIRRIQEKSPRAWMLGCSFLKPLEANELEAFLGGPSRASAESVQN